MKVKANKTEWQVRAKNLLMVELKRKGVTYTQLVENLHALGIEETERNIVNKASRGSFTAAFFLTCLEAAECQISHLR